MAGLFGNLFGNIFGNLFGEGQVSGTVWRRERRPIRRYTDWTRWSQVATDQVEARNNLDYLARIASDMPGAAAAAIVQLANQTQWLDIEFARTSDKLDDAEAQVRQVEAAVGDFEASITPEPPPPPALEVGDVLAKFRGA